MRASAERASLETFHILKLQFPSIFCWYFLYFISETNIFSGLKLHLHIHTINAVPCYYFWYGVVYKRQLYVHVYRQNTNIEKIYVYASERSERA